MIFLISPSKSMSQEDFIKPKRLPKFIDEAKCIAGKLKELTLEELRDLYICSMKIAEQNYERLQNFGTGRLENLTPAILAYTGAQFKNLDVKSLTADDYAYLDEHLIILSAMFGFLRPLDGVWPYRLEMASSLTLKNGQNLYDFWRPKINSALLDYVNEKDDCTIINLTSDEYSKVIKRSSRLKIIDVSFKISDKGRIVKRGMLSKQARGEMVRFAARNRLKNPEDLCDFKCLGFVFREDLSAENEYVFVKE